MRIPYPPKGLAMATGAWTPRDRRLAEGSQCMSGRSRGSGRRTGIEAAKSRRRRRERATGRNTAESGSLRRHEHESKSRTSVGRPCHRPIRRERQNSPVLSPPDAASQPAFPNSWTLAPLAVRLDEPTTRLPWQTADPALFHATTTAWNQWAITEKLMLQRAWGTSLSDVAQALHAGPVAELTDPDVLEFLDRVAPRLQAAGFDVIAPGGLLRAAPCAPAFSQSGSGTAVMKVDGLGLDAEVLVDGCH